MTGAAFAFMGIELRAVASAVPGDLSDLIVQALAITALAIVVRFL